MGTLMLLRHGETTFNAAQVFTGLLDVDLAPSGEAQVAIAARLIAAEGLVPDVLWQSTMRRAQRTTELLLGHLGRPQVPVLASWRLVERAYGCFTNLAKAEARRRYGEEAFFSWRRTMPAPVPERGPLPGGAGESLADVAARVMPFWRGTIEPLLADGRTVFVVSHGNTLRALASVVFDLPDDQVEHLKIPAGHPQVVTLADGIQARPRYLDPHTARIAADAVAAEGGT